MAGYSPSFGVSRFVSSRNEVVLRKTWGWSLEFRNVKEVALPVLLRNNMNRQRNQKFVVVVKISEPRGRPQSGVFVLKEGGDVVLESGCEATASSGVNDGDVLGGTGGSGRSSNGGGGGGNGGGGDDNEDDKEEEEFGPLLKFEEVMKETEARRATLPSDMLEAAKSVGIRKLLLLRYLDLQGSFWPLGFLMKSFSLLRNRMLADPSFLFKVGTEYPMKGEGWDHILPDLENLLWLIMISSVIMMVIDTVCVTFAEVQKRGKDFWSEFELYVADLLVGLVVTVALVGMLAPYVRIGRPTLSKGFLGRMQHAYGALPSSVFEAGKPGRRFSLKQRIGTYFYKGLMYGSVGFACGIVGQGLGNIIMTAKRSMKKNSEEDIPVPPLLKTAALWGAFLAVSSNTRYQIINGLERLVEASAFAKQVPSAAMAFTVGVRFANNVYGGMQFVDWAKWSGVQ